VPESIFEILVLVVVGLVSGALGGLLGIGGSTIMIPVLTIILKKDQHLSQAIGMIVGVFVAAPAMTQHLRARAVRKDVVLRMLPFGLVFIILGVMASDLLDGEDLKKIFGVFLMYVVFANAYRLIAGKPEPHVSEERTGWGPCAFVGTVMGFSAGLLGIGGGAISVPLLQRVCNLPLRQCIGTTTAVMGITAAVGSFRKNMTLPDQGLSIVESLITSAWLIPTAIVGSLIGATLTHALPLKYVRVAFILLMGWAGLEMLGVA
jgi:uncharacterized membrane protein YfcA